jgi:hypothetical protein
VFHHTDHCALYKRIGLMFKDAGEVPQDLRVLKELGDLARTPAGGQQLAKIQIVCEQDAPFRADFGKNFRVRHIA